MSGQINLFDNFTQCSPIEMTSDADVKQVNLVCLILCLCLRKLSQLFNRLLSDWNDKQHCDSGGY